MELVRAIETGGEAVSDGGGGRLIGSLAVMGGGSGVVGSGIDEPLKFKGTKPPVVAGGGSGDMGGGGRMPWCGSVVDDDGGGGVARGRGRLATAIGGGSPPPGVAISCVSECMCGSRGLV